MLVRPREVGLIYDDMDMGNGCALTAGAVRKVGRYLMELETMRDFILAMCRTGEVDVDELERLVIGDG
jgi:hypothetical protein